MATSSILYPAFLTKKEMKKLRKIMNSPTTHADDFGDIDVFEEIRRGEELI